MKISQESPVLLIIGTRPEGIKMAPVYHALKRAGIPTLLCSTMQHNELLEEVFTIFDFQPDIMFDIMRPGQDLFYITQAVLQKTKEVLVTYKPSLVLVQGDTTTAMAAALAAFYLRIPIGHVEAGLRTDDVYAPFPEEMNRRVIGMIASYHFAPTPSGVANLLASGLRRDQVFCTGNTVVDALYSIKEKIRTRELVVRADIEEQVLRVRKEHKYIGLLTIHRRESFGSDIVNVLSTIKEFALAHPDVFWFYPLHPNPHVIEAIQRVDLSGIENIYMCEPVSYKDLIYLLDKTSVVMTDSGGIQEEATSLGKPVLVLREKTERMEGILLGGARLVGFDAAMIRDGIVWALNQKDQLKREIAHIYGDGHAAEKIVAFIQAHYDELQDKKVETSFEKNDHMFFERREPNVKQVCVVGLGYIGLPTAIVAAESGFQVVGYDSDEKKVKEINEGNPVIRESEVYEKLQFVLGAKTFCAQNSIALADVFVVAVPTPITEHKTADMSFVYKAVDAIASVLKVGDLVLVESTIPVGETKKIAFKLQELTGLNCYTDFYVAHCPERVLPGNIFYELIHNDRIVGGVTKQAAEKAKSFYSEFITGTCYITSDEIAEMVKLVENSSRDVQLAFAHEVASMAHAKGVNPYELIELANKHPRVRILKPSCGVGGHCIAVDPWFLVESFPHESRLIKAAREVNDARPHDIVRQIKARVAHWSAQKNAVSKVLLCGVSYKPNVDDMRESPALQIVQELVNDASMEAYVIDSYVDAKRLQDLFKDRVVSKMDAFAAFDFVVFLVAHERFKLFDKKLLLNKQVIDVCGIMEQNTHSPLDQTFWPAKSIVDFVIPNQLIEDSDTQ